MKLLQTIAAASALLLSTTAIADEIQGQIDFTGGAVVTVSGGAVTEIDFDSPVVATTPGPTMDFDTYIDAGDAVAFVDPFDMTTPTMGLWSVGGFSFDLLSITSNSIIQVGAISLISVTGTGVITGNGFDTTAGTWSFTTQPTNSTGTFSFSSTTVPEPALMLVLALGLVGVGAARSRQAS